MQAFAVAAPDEPTVATEISTGIQIEEPFSVLPLHQMSMGAKTAVHLTISTWKLGQNIVEQAGNLSRIKSN